MKVPTFWRAGLNLLDQVISSATNALLSFLVARSVTNSEFGGFSVAFTIFAVFIGLNRAISATPISVRYAGSDAERFRRATASGVGTALALGLVGGTACLLAGVLLEGAVSTALLALGVVLPGLLVQDAWRLVFFAEARPGAAVLNDLVWAVLQIGSVVALVVAGMGTLGPLTLAWGLSACAAALLGLRQSGVRPRPSRAVRWVTRHRDLTGYLVLEYITVQGGHQLAMLAIAGIGSLGDVGALRGAQVLLGPATIIAVGMQTFFLPEYARRRDELDSRGWVMGAMKMSGLVTGLGVVWGAIFLVLPDAVGVELLGETWPETETVLLASVVYQAGAAVALGPATMLYAMDRARVTLSLHAVLAPLMFIGGIGGVLLGGAVGAAWGFAAAMWAVMPAWWIRMHREGVKVSAAVRDPEQPADTRDDTDW